jgi:hypothetical protein
VERRVVRRWCLTLALAVLAVPLAACSRDGEPAAPPRHRMEGTFIVHGVFPKRNFGAPCTGADAGFPDVAAGTVVRVKDGTGTTVGAAALEGGTLRKGKLRGRDDDCVFTFSLTVPERDDYRIGVGRGAGARFTRSDLERSNWKAGVTVGAYTMFGGI